MNGGGVPVKRRQPGQAGKLREMAGVDLHPVVEQRRPAEFVKHDHHNGSRMFGDDDLFGFECGLPDGMELMQKDSGKNHESDGGDRQPQRAPLNLSYKKTARPAPEVPAAS